MKIKLAKLSPPVHGTDKHKTLAPDQLQLEECVDENKLLLFLKFDHILSQLGTVGQLRLRELEHHRVIQHQLLEPCHILRKGCRCEDGLNEGVMDKSET